METRIYPEMTVVKCVVETTLMELCSGVADLPKIIVREAVDNNCYAMGPQHWIYTGSDGDPKTKFMLEICLPVLVEGETFVSDKFELVELPGGKYVSERAEGPWDNLGATYEKLMKGIKEHGFQPTGKTREVYLHCDFKNPANNVTEVLVQVAD